VRVNASMTGLSIPVMKLKIDVVASTGVVSTRLGTISRDINTSIHDTHMVPIHFVKINKFFTAKMSLP
jgi:hypothetical protein